MFTLRVLHPVLVWSKPSLWRKARNVGVVNTCVCLWLWVLWGSRHRASTASNLVPALHHSIMCICIILLYCTAVSHIHVVLLCHSAVPYYPHETSASCTTVNFGKKGVVGEVPLVCGFVIMVFGCMCKSMCVCNCAIPISAVHSRTGLEEEK